MGKVLITNMTEDDIDDIIEIESLCFKIPWSRESFVAELTTNKFAMYLVAKVDSKVVGYAGMWKVFDEGHITNIAVHPDFRRRGIAAGLIEVLINLAKQNEIERLTLEVRQSNSPAQMLYEKFGFAAEGLRKRYYADNQEDALIMWKVV